MALFFKDQYGGGQDQESLGSSKISPRETYAVAPLALKEQYSDHMRNAEQLVSALEGLSGTLNSIQKKQQQDDQMNGEMTAALVSNQMNSNEPYEAQLAKLRPDLSPWARAAASEALARNHATQAAQQAFETMPQDARNSPEASNQYFNSIISTAAQKNQSQPFYGPTYVNTLRQAFTGYSGTLSSERSRVMSEEIREDGRTQGYNTLQEAYKNGSIPYTPATSPYPEQAQEITALSKKYSLSPIDVAMLAKSAGIDLSNKEETAGNLDMLEKGLVSKGLQPGMKFQQMYSLLNPKGDPNQAAKDSFSTALDILGLPKDSQFLTQDGKGSSTSFRDSLKNSESGGRASVINASGYAGLYQFGVPRLKTLGVYSNDSGGKWNGQFAIPGFDNVKTIDDFLATPDAQEKVADLHFNDIDQQLASKDLLKYVGQEVGGVKITKDGLEAMAHLGGIGGTEKFLRTGGSYNPSDSNGTSLANYAAKFSKVATGSTGELTPSQYALRYALLSTDQMQAKTHPTYTNTLRKNDTIANVKQLAMENLDPGVLKAVPENWLSPAEKGDLAQWSSHIVKEQQARINSEWQLQQRNKQIASEKAMSNFNEFLLGVSPDQPIDERSRTAIMQQLNKIDPDLAAKAPKMIEDVLTGRLDPKIEQANYQNVEKTLYDVVNSGGDPTNVRLDSVSDPKLRVQAFQLARKLADNGGEMNNEYYTSNYQKNVEDVFGTVSPISTVKVNNPAASGEMKKEFYSHLMESVDGWKSSHKGTNITTNYQRSQIFQSAWDKTVQAYSYALPQEMKEALVTAKNKVPPSSSTNVPQSNGLIDEAVRKYGFGAE